jgi:hypothetical protein
MRRIIIVHNSQAIEIRHLPAFLVSSSSSAQTYRGSTRSLAASASILIMAVSSSGSGSGSGSNERKSLKPSSSSSSSSSSTSTSSSSDYLINLVWFGAVVYGIGYFLYYAYQIRLQAIKEYGPVIHEFDPYFNWRATQVRRELLS